MYSFIVELLKALLPFLKENVLQGQSVKAWVLKNKAATAWLVIHLTMTGLFITLAVILSQQTQLNRQLDWTNKQIIQQLERARERNRAVTEELVALEHVHNNLIAERDEAIRKADAMHAGLSICGVTITPTGTVMCPRATPPRRPRPPKRLPEALPPPQREEVKPTLRERLRNIFHKD